MRNATLMVCLAMVGFAGTARAANVTSLKPDSIVMALKNAGYKAALTKSDDGDPIIDTASDGADIRIVMSDCENHANCTTSEFLGVWNCTGVVEKCKKAAEEFNNTESPVKILLLKDGVTAVCYSYLLYDEAGISEKLLIKDFTSFSYYNVQFNAAVAKK